MPSQAQSVGLDETAKKTEKKRKFKYSNVQSFQNNNFDGRLVDNTNYEDKRMGNTKPITKEENRADDLAVMNSKLSPPGEVPERSLMLSTRDVVQMRRPMLNPRDVVQVKKPILSTRDVVQMKDQNPISGIVDSLKFVTLLTAMLRNCYPHLMVVTVSGFLELDTRTLSIGFMAEFRNHEHNSKSLALVQTREFNLKIVMTFALSRKSYPVAVDVSAVFRSDNPVSQDLALVYVTNEIDDFKTLNDTLTGNFQLYPKCLNTMEALIQQKLRSWDTDRGEGGEIRAGHVWKSTRRGGKKSKMQPLRDTGREGMNRLPDSGQGSQRKQLMRFPESNPLVAIQIQRKRKIDFIYLLMTTSDSRFIENWIKSCPGSMTWRFILLKDVRPKANDILVPFLSTEVTLLQRYTYLDLHRQFLLDGRGSTPVCLSDDMETKEVFQFLDHLQWRWMLTKPTQKHRTRGEKLRSGKVYAFSLSSDLSWKKSLDQNRVNVNGLEYLDRLTFEPSEEDVLLILMDDTQKRCADDLDNVLHIFIRSGGFVIPILMCDEKIDAMRSEFKTLSGRNWLYYCQETHEVTDLTKCINAHLGVNVET